jgi:nicotinate phosphoribosyltransferase
MKFKYWDEKTVRKIRRGYYSASYFNKTKEILLKEADLKTVTMQVFQKNNGAVLCGVNQVIELLKAGTGYFKNGKWISKWNELTVEALKDGKLLKSGEPVIHIKGPYAYFANLESLYLGILARQTRIATNAKNIVKAAGKKPVLFFADRFDYFLNQEPDGYAASVGGVTSVCTKAHGNWFGVEPVGTIPHSLIALHGGNTVEAVTKFNQYFPKNNLIALVDFNNDCASESLKIAGVFGTKLWGIRLDTAENLVDKSLQELTEKNNSLHGVNPKLVSLVRKTLDKKGFTHIKIIVSGGFNKDKINWFEKEKAPVDIYAVGSAMLEGKYDFTADIVKVDDRKIAKYGRRFKKLAI